MFLSDEWIAESRRIRDEFKDRLPSVGVSVRMNQVVNEVPFGDGVIKAHIDTSSGVLEVDHGHLENPDLTITLSYDTAKAIFVDGDAQEAMNAFLGGRIRVDGDVTKMIALQGTAVNVDPEAMKMVERIKQITA